MAELREAARRASALIPAIERMLLFGSLVHGRPTPRSDADILVVLQSSTTLRARDRIPEVLAAMSPLPCPVDLFVWTGDELERFTRTDEPLAREATGRGIDLLAQPALSPVAR